MVEFGGSLAFLFVVLVGTLWWSRRRTEAYERRIQADAQALGGEIVSRALERPPELLGRRVGGRRAIVLVEGQTVLELPLVPAGYTGLASSAEAAFGVGAGPTFGIDLRKGTDHRQPRLGLGYDTFVDWPELCCRVRLMRRDDPALWLLREALSPAVVRDLDGVLFGADGSLIFQWRGDLSPGQVKPIVRHLAAMAFTSLRPLEAAAALPGAKVTWPGTNVFKQKRPEASLRRGDAVASLHFSEHRWRLRADFDSRWPTFTAGVALGVPDGDWSNAALHRLRAPLRAVADGHVTSDAEGLEVAFVGLPDVARLDAGMTLLCRAATPTHQGAFR